MKVKKRDSNCIIVPLLTLVILDQYLHGVMEGTQGRIWERLVKVLINYEWSQKFTNTIVTHFIRTGSDHSPLSIIIDNTQHIPKKYFEFLDY